MNADTNHNTCDPDPPDTDTSDGDSDTPDTSYDDVPGTEQGNIPDPSNPDDQ
jgi:hypothetical protein